MIAELKIFYFSKNDHWDAEEFLTLNLCWYAPIGMQSMLTAKNFYVGDEVTETKRQAVRMAVDTKAPGQAPPDLPSLLLDGRILYIGMAVSRIFFFLKFYESFFTSRDC